VAWAIVPRAHFSEKPAPAPLNTGRVYLFPHLVLGYRNKKAGLHSSQKPQNRSRIWNKKRGGRPFLHLKWPGAGQKSWLAARKCFSQRPFRRYVFPGRDPADQLFCPCFYLGRCSWHLNGNAPIKNACTWPFSAPGSFYRKWVLGPREPNDPRQIKLRSRCAFWFLIFASRFFYEGASFFVFLPLSCPPPPV
jgi:hypothetical protein